MLFVDVDSLNAQRSWQTILDKQTHLLAMRLLSRKSADLDDLNPNLSMTFHRHKPAKCGMLSATQTSRSILCQEDNIIPQAGSHRR